MVDILHALSINIMHINRAQVKLLRYVKICIISFHFLTRRQMKLIFQLCCVSTNRKNQNIRILRLPSHKFIKIFQCVMTIDIIMLKTKLQRMSEFPRLNINVPS